MLWNRFVAMERFSSFPSSVLWLRSAPGAPGGLNHSNRAVPGPSADLGYRDAGGRLHRWTGMHRVRQHGRCCRQTPAEAHPRPSLLSAAVRDDSVPPPPLSVCLCPSRSTVSLLPAFCLTLPQIKLTFLSLLFYDKGCQTYGPVPFGGPP